MVFGECCTQSPLHVAALGARAAMTWRVLRRGSAVAGRRGGQRWRVKGDGVRQHATAAGRYLLAA